jgi:hypothetical protein
VQGGAESVSWGHVGVSRLVEVDPLGPGDEPWSITLGDK